MNINLNEFLMNHHFEPYFEPEEKGIRRMSSFPVTKTVRQKRNRPDHLKFGRSFTDHMFMMEYDEKKVGIMARVIPYAPLSLEPAQQWCFIMPGNV
jgi:hypothetical protein